MPVLAEICQAHAKIRQQMEAERTSLLLVLGGPEVAGVPVVDTPTMARSLFAEAHTDVIVATYVINTPAEFFKPLADLFDTVDGFRVRIIVDLSPKRKTKDEPLPIVENRFKKQFLDNSWPGKMAPELWFDPRPFSDGTNGGGVMHAKALIVDKTAALITSANFTEAAHQRNIEAGVLLRNQHEVSRLRRYFEGLMECGHLRKIL
jgi:phosphatidylserine/phosphatidylglycerophosphate/cardiolipin synthase-like enzyme